MPLVQDARFCTQFRRSVEDQAKRGTEDMRELPHKVYNNSCDKNLNSHVPVVDRVRCLEKPHHRKRHHKVKRVEGVDVVQDKSVAENQTEPEYKKIETPHHLQKANNTKVAFGVKK